MKTIKLAAAAIAATALGALAPSQAAAQPAATVTCESRDGDRTWCWATDTSRGVQLVEQMSDSRCVQGRTWGYTRERIWVSNGCRGRFRIAADGARDSNDGWLRNRDRDRDNGGWLGNRGSSRSLENAERVCERAVQRRYDLNSRQVSVGESRRQGNRVRMEWRARGTSGVCVFDRRGALERVVANRNRNR